MLAVPMAARHVTTIRTAGMLARAEMFKQFEAYDAAFNKLTRTFAAQVDALRQYHNCGKQTVTCNTSLPKMAGRPLSGKSRMGEA